MRTLHGTLRLTSIMPRGPPQSVYNLEIHGEHVYQVSRAGIVVHNSTPTPKRAIRKFPKEWNLGLKFTFNADGTIQFTKAEGVIYQITGSRSGAKQNYVGSAYDRARLQKRPSVNAGKPTKGHPARDLMLHGDNVKVRVRRIEFAEAATQAFNDALRSGKEITPRRAAERVLHSIEQDYISRIQRSTRMGDNLNDIRAKNPKKRAKYKKYTDQANITYRRRPKNLTSDIVPDVTKKPKCS